MYMEPHKMIERIYDIQTGEILEKEYDEKQLLEAQEMQAKAEAETLAKIKSETKRQALLAKLGITEDEAKLLFF